MGSLSLGVRPEASAFGSHEMTPPVSPLVPTELDTGRMVDETPLALGLPEQIAARIRNDVLCGRLPGGQRLRESDLVSRFGVSRTPIREALRQLIQEGLLDCKPNSGVSVSKCPPDAVRDLVVPIRRTLESYALRAFFDQINDDDYRVWEQILGRMREACVESDFHSIAEHDIMFHRSIVCRARLPDIEAIWASLVARVRSHFWESHRRDYLDPLEIHAEHIEVLDAIRTGDVEQAVQVLEKHIA